MEFNEYCEFISIRIKANMIEDYELMEQVCMNMYEQTGEWSYLSAASRAHVQANHARKSAVKEGWYLV